ncbi:MAG TPA: hypothetical protein VMV79_04975 [Alphaproteobacteria bacterium]|nr:hypothetical protein [Alphaproteobacteria bacterium]
MGIYNRAAWSVILGLALILVGGLVLWAYRARADAGASQLAGPEADAARLFHTRLARWFFAYGLAVIALGLGFLGWGASIFFP